jgi:hypothetical protein
VTRPPWHRPIASTDTDTGTGATTNFFYLDCGIEAVPLPCVPKRPRPRSQGRPTATFRRSIHPHSSPPFPFPICCPSHSYPTLVMVIDTKLPPDDSAPLPAPPPAYAPPSQEPSPNPPPQFQQYPPSSGQNYSGSPPQWNAPVTGSQSIPPEEWVGQQYRNQRKSSSRRSHFPDHNVFSVFAQCARGNHDETTSFGLCGIICAILLFPIGLIFLWYAMICLLPGRQRR